MVVVVMVTILKGVVKSQLEEGQKVGVMMQEVKVVVMVVGLLMVVVVVKLLVVGKLVVKVVVMMLEVVLMLLVGVKLVGLGEEQK